MSPIVVVVVVLRLLMSCYNSVYCCLLNLYSRVHKKCNNLRINYRGDVAFVATFGVNNASIHMSYCSFLVQGGPLHTVSYPSVVDD